MTATVTITLATYGRPDTLRCAIQSVLQQTMPHWRLLVIGDHCGEETAQAMEPFLADPRIRYVNLPWRCGEQALPNSAGMAHAQTDRIAFLNHDDLWHPSHLQEAIKHLDQSGADFYFARSAWIWEATDSPDTLPALETISPLVENFTQIFMSDFGLVEPVSAWVISRALAEKVGPWRSASALFRTPIHDWVLRACRTGARIASGTGVTCFKFENQWSEKAPQQKYDTPALPQQALLRAMAEPARLQALGRRLQRLAGQPGAIGHKMPLNPAPSPQAEVLQMTGMLLSPTTANYFLQSNLDAYTWLCAELGLARGWRWRWALQQRTGETEIHPPDFSDVSAYVQTALATQAWSNDA